MKRFLIIFLLTLFIPNIKVDAFYCKYNEISRYKNLASNITTYYDYTEKEDNVTFTITLVNLNKDLYIVDSTTNKKYTYKNNELSITNYSPGQTVKYYVYTTNENCSDELLYTIRVNLPDYNPYYDDIICEGVNNYIYCTKWYKHNLNYEQFVAKVNSYKQSLIKPPEPSIPEEPTGLGLLDIVLEIWIRYYYIILLAIITSCSIIIYNTNKKSDIYR